jgi:hypothetical protein
MDALKLFLRGLAAFLIAGAVCSIIISVLNALLPASLEYVSGITGLVAMVVTALLLYPRVKGTPRRWGSSKSTAHANQE